MSPMGGAGTGSGSGVRTTSHASGGGGSSGHASAAAAAAAAAQQHHAYRNVSLEGLWTFFRGRSPETATPMSMMTTAQSPVPYVTTTTEGDDDDDDDFDDDEDGDGYYDDDDTGDGGAGTAAAPTTASGSGGDDRSSGAGDCVELRDQQPRPSTVETGAGPTVRLGDARTAAAASGLSTGEHTAAAGDALDAATITVYEPASTLDVPHADAAATSAGAAPARGAAGSIVSPPSTLSLSVSSASSSSSSSFAFGAAPAAPTVAAGPEPAAGSSGGVQQLAHA